MLTNASFTTMLPVVDMAVRPSHTYWTPVHRVSATATHSTAIATAGRSWPNTGNSPSPTAASWTTVLTLAPLRAGMARPRRAQ